MIITTVLALVFGIMVGATLEMRIIDQLVDYREYILYILMFSVGISIGLHEGFINKLKEYHVKIFLIPFGIILGSLIGGVMCSFALGHSMQDSLAIASGLGWYSLAGVSITNLAGATVGSIAFLSNLLREIFSFILIPFLAKYLNDFTCIAPAGATSEDTTLPILIKYTNPTTAVLAVFNGVVCSAAVPILITIIYSI